MKTNCPYPQCNQSIEYPKEYAGVAYPCPSCHGTLVLPKLSIIDRIKGWWTSFANIWFDRKACLPGKDSPYHAIIGLIYAVYYIIVGILLIWTAGVAMIVIPLSYLISVIPKSEFGIGMILLVFPSAILSWILIHIPYKIVRVIFDIAEYNRKISEKSNLS